MDTQVLKVQQLSKCYQIYDHPRDRLIQALWGRDRHLKRKQFYQEFWALRELSFSLSRGQTLGVVGRNGSGKSTLLQLICGTLTPSSGKVEIKGRVGALLELGSGFNPDFSGLENVFLNAALLGLSKAETEERLDQILAFADIGNFVHQPVKTYSSGMAVRLAFAVQAHIDPDLLVVDEALAVGDELFQKKCYSRLERLKENGTSVLLVTHSCPQIIQQCDQALLLHKGRARMLDEPVRVTLTYQRLINASDAEWDAAFATPDANSLGMTHEEKTFTKAAEHAWLDPHLIPQSSEEYPSKGAAIVNARIERLSGDEANVFRAREHFDIILTYEAQSDLDSLSFICNLTRVTGQRVSGQTYPASNEAGVGLACKAGDRWEIRYRFHGGLWPGTYFVNASIMRTDQEGRHFIHRVIDYRALKILEIDERMSVGTCDLQRDQPILRLLVSQQERAGT